MTGTCSDATFTVFPPLGFCPRIDAGESDAADGLRGCIRPLERRSRRDGALTNA